MKLDDRVRLVVDADIFNLGKFPKGAIGQLAEATPEAPAGSPIYEIKLDRHFPDLDEWENHLQVFRDGEGEVNVGAFEVLPLGGDDPI